MRIAITIFSLALFFALNQTRSQDQSYYMLPYTPDLTSGEYTLLPQENFINPNKETRVFHTPTETILIPPNIRVHPTSNRQTETVIVRHPLNQSMMFGSANVQSPGISEGVYVTTNNGVNWFGSDTLMGLPLNTHGGDPGIVIDKNGVFIMVHIGSGSVPGMASNFSTDNGLTWSNSIQIEAGSLLQHEASTGTDDTPWSPFYGRSYTTYTNVSGIRRVQFVHTTDGAMSWSAPITISPVSSSGHYAAWSDMPSRTGPGGEIYVIWNNYINTGSIPDSIGFAKSTDGGINWTNATNTAFNIDGLPTSSTINGMRYFHFPRIDVDRSGGPRNGWIYIVTNERFTAPATDLADVIFHRSTDGGVTWSNGIRVNQDTPGNGKYQVFPAIRVDEASNINIVYYDSRNTPTNDSVEVIVSRSTDGGNTWVDIIVSDHKSRPKSGYQGDYIGITSSNGKVWPLWMDDFSGVQQAWTVGVDILTGVVENGSAPKNFSLKQNYPNPFNPTTKIGFEIKDERFVTLAVYDITGREVAKLINADLKPKAYEITWDATGYPSGVYFYKLIAGDPSSSSGQVFTETKKMILLK
ncbi:MAG: T9SS type A sorting domain-containing protein [Chlorobi bacterium]|nr:T9SS type A sorting domain-containing protein [Chlorobiota bacterium]MCI0715410.1 T9SS type A sorting domain-containing protein [Chlorobiota bacterium]